jgi:hypothetical protein
VHSSLDYRFLGTCEAGQVKQTFSSRVDMFLSRLRGFPDARRGKIAAMPHQNCQAPSSNADEVQPLFFVNYLDKQDRKSIGRHAQLAAHRKRRAKKIADVAQSKNGILATGPLPWRPKVSFPVNSRAVEKSIISVSPQTLLGAGRKDPFLAIRFPLTRKLTLSLIIVSSEQSIRP